MDVMGTGWVLASVPAEIFMPLCLWRARALKIREPTHHVSCLVLDSLNHKTTLNLPKARQK